MGYSTLCHSHRTPTLSVSLAATLVAVAACSEEPTSVTPTISAPSSGPELTIAGPGSWTEKAAIPEALARFESTAGVVKNIVYVLGGFSGQNLEEHPATSILAYDIATNSWTTKAAVFTTERTNGAGTIGGKLYISGSENHFTGTLSSALFAYDPVTDRVTRKANMPRRTGTGVSGVIDGKLYVLAGNCIVGGVRVACRYLYRYDPATDTWATLAKVPTDHYPGLVGGVIGGKFYVTGGGTNSTNRKRLDAYDPSTNTWRQRASVPVEGATAAAVLGGKLYLFFRPSLATYVYNPVTNTWTAKAPYPGEAVVSGPNAAFRVTLDGTPHIIAVSSFFHDNADHTSKPAPSQMFTP